MTRSKEAMKRRSARKNARRRTMGRNGDANAAIRKYYAGKYALFTPMALDVEPNMLIVTDVMYDVVGLYQEMYYGNVEITVWFNESVVETIVAWHDQVYLPVDSDVSCF